MSTRPGVAQAIGFPPPFNLYLIIPNLERWQLMWDSDAGAHASEILGLFFSTFITEKFWYLTLNFETFQNIKLNP